MRILNIKTALFTLVIVLVLVATSFTSCITFTRPGETTPAQTTYIATETPVSTTAVSAVNPKWTPATPDSEAIDLRYTIPDVVEMVKPAVVSITTEVISYDFFNRPYTSEGAGSGWIIDSDGIIVTNNHVVEGAKTITVTMDNGDQYTADTSSVYTDALNDLAIIKITATGLPALKTGDASKLRLGEWVIAIGNALGQGTRVTEGIISRIDVTLPIEQGQTLYNLIETSAAINPGNSGGPLISLSGEVIGITSAKVASVGVEGMGYAINVNTATPIIQELVNKGYVTRPFLGVSLYTVDALAIREFDLKVDEGVLLLEVSAGTPASRAGLREGDVIVNMDGKSVTSVEEFTTILHNATIGEPLEIKYWRGSKENTTTAIPVEAPRS